MQNWDIYLSSVLFLSFIFGCIYFHEEHGKGELLGFVFSSVAIALWPVTLCLIPVGFLVSGFYKRYNDSFISVRNRVNLQSHDNYENNSAIISEASTPDLKLLLKGTRLGKIQLKSNQIEIIKRELLNRATENGLLK